MLRFAASLLAGALVLSACGSERAHVPVLETEPPPEAVLPEAVVGDAPLLEIPSRGLELQDGEAGVTVIDIGPQDDISGISPPKFALHCGAAAKTVTVAAPARQLGEFAIDGPAALVVSGQAFEGLAALVPGDSTEMQMTLALTPDLLAAIATTTTARLVVGDGFAESNTDTNGAFPGFAGQCSLGAGVPLPPR